MRRGAEGLSAQPQGVAYGGVLEGEDQGGVCLLGASVFREEPARPSNVEVLVVLFQPPSYLSYLVSRRHRV